MKLTTAALTAYLSDLLGGPVEALNLGPLDNAADNPSPTRTERRLKTYGYGKPLLLRYVFAGEEQRAVLRTVAANPFGHERRADRAANLLLCYDTFNELPQHVSALDIGVLTSEAEPRSLGAGDEFFLLTEYVPGQAYAADLERMRDSGSATELDLRRARGLAEYLAAIHAVRHDDPALYRRHLRDVLGSGEGLMGIADSYPPDFALAPGQWLEQVEQRCVEWRWRLKAYTHRLAPIHGDFHPYNVLFSEGTDFWLLDRSRGPMGEPGDDVSCMAINYLFFSLQRANGLVEPFTQLWDIFWNTYLERSDDQQILDVVAPFFAWRALVIASPMWYNIADSVRKTLFRFVDHVLRVPVFEPAHIHTYLAW